MIRIHLKRHVGRYFVIATKGQIIEHILKLIADIGLPIGISEQRKKQSANIYLSSVWRPAAELLKR